MTWLTWRQFRAQTVTALATMAVYAILLAATGPHLASMYAADGLGSCRGGSCANLASYFTGSLLRSPYMVLFLLSVGVILLAPAVIGLFWGAPLIARELETGTAALAWNQSVTRTRWLAVKLTVGVAGAIAVTEALCLMQSWWAAPIGRAVGDGAASGVLAQGRFTQLVFDTHGVTPLGYAVFAFALGVTAGALIRRTVPAMAVTLAIFAAIQVAMPLWVRPNLAPPGHVVIPVSSVGNGPATDGSAFTLTALSVPGQPGAWLLSSGPVNATGQPVSTIPAPCIAESIKASLGSEPSSGDSAPAPNLSGFADCLTSQGIREAITYQPASRYWPFQWTETAIYLVLALALAGYSFRRLSRRLS
jgi:hypothetical protein